jgi:hypothetical protein
MPSRTTVDRVFAIGITPSSNAALVWGAVVVLVAAAIAPVGTGRFRAAVASVTDVAGSAFDIELARCIADVIVAAGLNI